MQLPAGACSRDARLAPTRSGRSSNLVSGSSCPSAPRRINSSRSAQARRVNRTVSRSSRRTRTSPPCWRRRPRGKAPGCGGVGVAAQLRTALGAKTASDVAKKNTSRARRRVGTRARRRGTRGARRAGVCDAPVVSRGAANGTVGVHTSLTAARGSAGRDRGSNRSPPRPEDAGTFEPVRVWECDRVDWLVDAMARDLAGRVCDDAAAEKRWPRTLTASVATKIAPDAATTTKSKSRAFPAKTPNARGWSELDVANACAEACRALVRATIVGVDAETLVTKVSLTATGFKPERSGDDTHKSAFRRMGGDADGETGGERGGERGGAGKGRGCGRRPAPRDDGVFLRRSASIRARADATRRRRRGRGRDGGTFRAGRRMSAADAAEASRPLPVASMWRLLGARKITAEEVRDARRRRLERVGKMRIGNT